MNYIHKHKKTQYNSIYKTDFPEQRCAAYRVMQLEIASQTGADWHYELFLLNRIVNMTVESLRNVVFR